MSENIAAIATGLTNAALGIIRISGATCINEINKIFSKDLTKYNKTSLIHGYIKADDKVLDEVMLSLYLAPKSFTGEDLIEITTHGGTLLIQEVLSLILSLDIRLAEPGEFSKRAYLNQKMDLIQAESIIELIDAETNTALDIARNGLLKKTSELLNKPLEILLDTLTKLEAFIDYPDYEFEAKDFIDMERVYFNLSEVDNILKAIIKKSDKTYTLASGIKVAIVGKPNVGKSSLLNALVEKKKAIVTDIEGTTRDAIEASIIYNNIKITFIDTAGIRNTTDKIEQIGVKISKASIKEADVVLLLLDNSREFSENDQELLKLIKNKNHLVIVNKTDLANKLVIPSYIKYIKIAAKKNKGIRELKEKIISFYNIDNDSTNLVGLFSVRQISSIKKVSKDISNVIKDLTNGYYEVITQGIRQVYENLLLITGKVYNQDIEKNIFKKFCLGK